MTIDEAIAMVNNRAIICEHSYDRFIQLEKKQWEQVSEWLEELKKYRTLDKTNFLDGYNKAIDEFADRLTRYLGVENATKYGNKNAEQMRNSYETLMNYEIAESIDDVAEQLKAGGENGADNQ